MPDKEMLGVLNLLNENERAKYYKKFGLSVQSDK
jgi:hypothetical protein